jgi:hypothetical protein
VGRSPEPNPGFGLSDLPSAVSFDAVFEPDHGAEVVDSGLTGWSAAGGWMVGLRVIQFHAVGGGGVGEAAGGHAQEHGFADAPRYLVAVSWRGDLGVDDGLDPDVAVGVGEKATDPVGW